MDDPFSDPNPNQAPARSILEHEQHHIRIYLRNYRSLQADANPKEGCWNTEACASAAVVYINATRDYYVNKTLAENSEFDIASYGTSRPSIGEKLEAVLNASEIRAAEAQRRANEAAKMPFGCAKARGVTLKTDNMNSQKSCLLAGIICMAAHIHAAPNGTLSLELLVDPGGIGTHEIFTCLIPVKQWTRIEQLRKDSAKVDLMRAAFNYMQGYNFNSCQREAGFSLVSEALFADQWTKMGMMDAIHPEHGYRYGNPDQNPLTSLGYLSVEFSGKVVGSEEMFVFSPHESNQLWLIVPSRTVRNKIDVLVDANKGRPIELTMNGSLSPLGRYSIPLCRIMCHRLFVVKEFAVDQLKLLEDQP